MSSSKQVERAAYVSVPDWVKKEDAKYQPVFMARLFSWAMFGMPDEAIAKEYFKGSAEGWTDEDAEYVYRRFVEEGYIAAFDSKEQYVLVDHGWPADRERTVLRRIEGDAPERFDYGTNGWVEDWDRWYSHTINDNSNYPIGKLQAAAIIRKHGGNPRI